jgi:DNA-binding NarL/FixJ family response regulator
MVRIGITEKHEVYRKAMIKLLGKNKAYELVLEANSRLDFLSQYGHADGGVIDVLLIDIDILLKDQYNLIRQTKRSNPKLKILALVFNTDSIYYQGLFRSGIDGIVTKHGGSKLFSKAIDTVLNGAYFLPDDMDQEMVNNILKQSKMETKKILLVDDDIDIITVAKAILKKEGFEVYTASNKVEGIKMAKDIRPDLAILDVMMTTHFEGFELAKAFKDDTDLKRIPVMMQSSIDILISSDYSVFDMAKSMRSQAQYKELDVLLIKDNHSGEGCVDYRTADNKNHSIKVEGFIKKPIEAEFLVNQVNKLLHH